MAEPDDPRPLSPAERRAERLAQILDVPVTAGGFLFLLIVVADTTAPRDFVEPRVWSIVGWALWGLFALEFAARLVMARSTAAFLRRNWWQLIFLVVPFLRFLRAFSRTARLARLGSSSLRSSRSAAATLGSRIALLAAWTATVVLAGAVALVEFGDVRPISDAVEAAALAAIAGEPVVDMEGWARLVPIALVLWSAIGFASLAGAIGAYLVGRPVQPLDATPVAETMELTRSQVSTSDSARAATGIVGGGAPTI